MTDSQCSSKALLPCPFCGHSAALHADDGDKWHQVVCGSNCLETTPEVWAVIKARHGDDLKVFSSFSDPTGTAFGGGGTRGRMETTYGLNGADYPLIGARTDWNIGDKNERLDVQHEYFLFISKKDACDE